MFQITFEFVFVILSHTSIMHCFSHKYACSAEVIALADPYVIGGFSPQAIAHYEQAADYYKGEESNR